MDRTLVLIRHAKAGDGTIDIRRPLTSRGERDAAAIGEWLAGNGLVPTHAVVSEAVRARQTWGAALAQLPGAPPEVALDDRLYANDADQLLAVVQETAAGARTLALVGHNPSMHELAVRLDDGAGDANLRVALREGFPTSAIAAFSVGAWAQVRAGGGRLVAYGVGRA